MADILIWIGAKLKSKALAGGSYPRSHLFFTFSKTAGAVCDKCRLWHHRENEDGHIAQAMESDGDKQATLDLIRHSKEKATRQLGE